MYSSDRPRIITKNPDGKITQELRANIFVGEGTFGQVWRTTPCLPNKENQPLTFEVSEDKFPIRPVVIKHLKNISKRDFKEQMLLTKTEARFLRCVHDNWKMDIAVLEDALSLSIALVMPFYSGRTLEDIQLLNLITLPEFFKLGIMIIEAVNAMHSKGIIHLDLKAKNILANIKKHAVKDICIVDFGMAEENDFLIDQMTASPHYDFTPYSSDRITEPHALIKRLTAQPRHDYYSIAVILGILLENKLVHIDDHDKKPILLKIIETRDHYNLSQNKTDDNFQKLHMFFKNEGQASQSSLNQNEIDDIFAIDL